MDSLLAVRQLTKSFSVASRLRGRHPQQLQAVAGVSFDLFPGETLGLVGESGCGKSTTGKLLLRLLDPDGGSIHYRDQDLARLSRRQMRPLRRELQMIFQDPYSSLNPRMKVEAIVGEPLLIHDLVPRSAMRSEVLRLLQTVGLNQDHLERYPHEFSGGQRQRIGIARALAGRPRLIVADEPVSALDLSVQAQVLNLLRDIQQQFDLTYLFIAHDLSVIANISNRVAVMYLGRIVELAPVAELFRHPLHPYSEALLEAIPCPDPQQHRTRSPLPGEPPSPLAPPPGCPFHPRCRYAAPLCRELPPPLEEKSAGRLAACHFSDRVGRG